MDLQRCMKAGDRYLMSYDIDNGYGFRGVSLPHARVLDYRVVQRLTTAVTSLTSACQSTFTN